MAEISKRVSAERETRRRVKAATARRDPERRVPAADVKTLRGSGHTARALPPGLVDQDTGQVDEHISVDRGWPRPTNCPRTCRPSTSMWQLTADAAVICRATVHVIVDTTTVCL